MRRRSRGFSLLELLVVLFVVIMITSLASLNVGSGNQNLRLEAQLRDLRNVALFAFDEAQLSGRDIGLLVLIERRDGETVYGYDWRERRPEGWRRPLAASDVFARRTLPPEVRLLLALENMPAIEPEPAPVADDVAPQVIFYASGEVVPGELALRRREDDELLWLLQWDLLGRMELLAKGLPAGEGRDGSF